MGVSCRMGEGSGRADRQVNFRKDTNHPQSWDAEKKRVPPFSRRQRQSNMPVQPQGCLRRQPSTGLRNLSEQNVVSAIGRLRQENCHNFKVSMSYLVGSRSA